MNGLTASLNVWTLRGAIALAALGGFPGLSAPTTITRAAGARKSAFVRGARPAPVKLRGVVTSFSGWKNSFFLEDASGAISIDRLEDTSLEAGDEVEVTGEVHPGLFAPVVVSSAITVVGHPGPPPPRRSAYIDLAGGRYDSRFVRITGVIQSARVENVWSKNVLVADLHTPGGVISVHVLTPPAENVDNLIDSTVQVTGVCGTIFNDRRQFVGVRLFVSTLNQIRTVTASRDPASLPPTPLGSLSRFDSTLQNHRVHVSGTVTYQAGSVLYLQENGNAIRLESFTPGSFEPGSRVDAWGFVSNGAYSPLLHNTVVKASGKGADIVPLSILATHVITAESGFAQAPYDGLLVEIEGEVTERVPGEQRLLLGVRQGAIAFQAQLNAAFPDQMIALEPGASVRLTGILINDVDEVGNLKSFRILLRSPRDVNVLTAPSWNHSFLLLLLMFLMVITGSVIAWLAHGRREIVPSVDQSSALLNSRLQRASGVFAASASLIGFLCLGLWVFRGSPDSIFQRYYQVLTPNGALALFAVGAAMTINLRRRAFPLNALAAIAGWLVFLLSVITIAEYITGWDFNVDTLLIGRASAPVISGQVSSFRMGLASAFCLLLASSAIGLGTGRRFTGIGQVLAIATGALSLLNLVSRLYGHEDYAAGANAGMPLAMAAGLLLLSLAIPLCRPDGGAMRTFCASSPGGLMARRMIPVTIVWPVIIGWIRLQGQNAGLYDTRFGLAIFAVCSVVSFCFLVWSSAALLNRLEGERSIVERSLRDRERKLEMIFETGTIGDFTWEPGVDRVTAHPSIWRLYGEPDRQGSAPGDWFRARQHPDDKDFIDRSLDTAFESCGSFDIEFRVVWPDLSIHWIGCRGTAVYGTDGGVLQVNGLNIDVTDRKMAELRLAESEILFRELADAMPQIVWTAAADGKTTYYNRRWYEYTGLQNGTDWAGAKPDIIHPEDLNGCLDAFAVALRDGSAYEYELRLRRAADESYRWHLVRAVPILNESGAVECWFGTSTDIDDFKRASSQLAVMNENLEQRVQERSCQLAESEGRFRQLVENVKDYAIFMLDPEGRIATWNAGAQRISGYTAGEAIGRHVSIFHSETDIQEELPQQHLSLAAAEGQHRMEGWCQRRDGSAFWASVLVTSIRGRDGEVTAFSKIVRDMTEQKQAEQLLRSERARAEDANRAKSSFLAAMSHEIRTPMNAILGMADLLWDTDLHSTQREYVGRFRSAGTNLLTLINDILDLSKIESGRFDLENVEFDLSELLERTSRMMEPKARLKNITLAIEAVDAISHHYRGDPARLQQVLLNLIGNAVKFTEKGGVTVTVAPHPDQREGHLQFAVSDSGIGIPEDKLETIFEDFTQAESSTTRRFGGTGLGLGISRRLVERMGGRLMVQNSSSAGSKIAFDVHLSVCPRANSFQAKELMDMSGVRVLVVDDESVNRLILAEMCSEWGMIVSEADCLPVACRILSGAFATAEQFGLVLLDRVMPGVDGLDALREIRAIDSRLVVLITSSDDQPGDVTRAIAMGAAGYLMKPIRKAHLLSVLSTTLLKDVHPRQAQTASGRPAAIEPPRARMKILIAEDSEDNRFLVKAYLNREPYELVFVSNGREALDMFALDNFDLILMDIQMPVMDGLTATALIHTLEREQERTFTPIVALTANALVEDRERSQAAGCNAHLSKPISKEKLIDTIESFRKAPAPFIVNPESVVEDHYERSFAEEFRELSEGYLHAKREEMEHLRRLVEAQQLDELQILGHNLKGSAGSFGFQELTNLGHSLEAAAKAADLHSLRLHVPQIEAYLSNPFETIWSRTL